MRKIHNILKVLSKHKSRTITLRAACVLTGLEPSPALQIMRLLEKEGLLSRLGNGVKGKAAGRGNRINPKWKLVARKKYTERLREVGKKRLSPQMDKMWRLMRINRTFASGDLIAVAGASKSSAYDFLSQLKRNDRIIAVARTGRGIVWQLASATPPIERPILQEKEK